MDGRASVYCLQLFNPIVYLAAPQSSGPRQEVILRPGCVCSHVLTRLGGLDHNFRESSQSLAEGLGVSNFDSLRYLRWL